MNAKHTPQSGCSAKPTPGPWEAERFGPGKGAWEITGKNDTLHIGVIETSSEDARLIVAAPDLLQAIEDILDRLGTIPMQDDELAHVCRKAISKARGAA